jgi:hypothetical protein
MNFEGYTVVRVGEIPKAKLKKAAKTGKLSLTMDQINGNKHLVLHPMNAMKLIKSQQSGKGVQGLVLTSDEIAKDLKYHQLRGASISGGSFWSWLKTAASDVGNWLKDSGVGSVVADALVPAAATVLGPAGAVVARNVLKTTTGVGLKPRKKRMTGSSFMIN